MNNVLFYVAILFTIFGIGTIESVQPGGRWKQVGNTVSGTIPGGFLGSNVAISSDGNTIVVKALESVVVYTYNPLSRKWVQIGEEIVISRISTNAITMSADGKMFAIGLPFGKNRNGIEAGIVKIYTIDSRVRNLIQVGSDIEGAGESDQFGVFVSMSADGKTIAICSNNFTSRSKNGNVSVFTFNSITKTWLQIGNVINGDKNLFQAITTIDLSANGKTVAIGVDGVFNVETHFVHVYRFISATKKWTQIGSDIIGETADDNFGFSIAISENGKTIAIGASSNDGNGIASGHVRVLSFNDRLLRWVQVGSDIDGEAAFDFFGSSVSISDDGKIVAVGAAGNDNPNGVNSGHVRVYSYVASTRIWTQIGSDINGMSTGDFSGKELAMSADGSTIIIGASESNSVRGYIRVFKYKPPQDCSTTSWRLYNLQNNTIVDTLVNGIMIQKPPPCGYANIEAFVPCATTNSTSYVVTMELYDHQNKLYKTRTDIKSPYFLYGKYGTIKAGTYKIRAIVNSTSSPYTSIVSPYTTFTLYGNCA